MRVFSSMFVVVALLLGLQQLAPMLMADADGQVCIAAELSAPADRVRACTQVLARENTPADRSRALVYRAMAHLDENALDPALGDLHLALELVPDNALALLNHALALTRQGNLAAALADLDRAERLAAPLEDVYAARGYIHFQREEMEMALADILRFQHVSSGNGWASNMRGHILARLGRIDEALEHLVLASRQDAGNFGFADDAQRLAAQNAKQANQ